MRFSDSHRVAIRVTELRTGRDIGAELRAQVDATVADTAVWVYSTILSGLGTLEVDPDMVLGHLTSDSEPRRALAGRLLYGLLAEAPPAEAGLATEVVDRFLSVLIEGAELWPALYPDWVRNSGLGQGSGHREDADPVLLLDENLPPGVREMWADRVGVLDSRESRPAREASTLYRVGPVLRAGPFLRVRADYSTRLERSEDESPGGYAGSFTVTLVLTNGEWHLVSVGMSVT